ncbi:hypothetical protein Btru_057257 [Bulinus truncatus]|nr:hypothetical protein Btru_057257 [Bulinus truncatus]
MPRRPTEISQLDHISIDSTGPQKHIPVDRDLMVNWSCAYPPVQFREVPCLDVQHEPQYYVSRATFWNNNQAVDWASMNNLPETARTLNTCRFNGQHLLHSDAVKLQAVDWASMNNLPETARTLNTCRFNGQHLLHSDAVKLQVRTGDSTCPCYSVLSTLSTDPWVDNTSQILQMTSNESGKSTWDNSDLKPRSKKIRQRDGVTVSSENAGESHVEAGCGKPCVRWLGKVICKLAWESHVVAGWGKPCESHLVELFLSMKAKTIIGTLNFERLNHVKNMKDIKGCKRIMQKGHPGADVAIYLHKLSRKYLEFCSDLRPTKDKLEHRTKDKLEHKTKDKLEHKTKDKLEHKTKDKLEHKTKDKLEHRTKDKLEHKTKDKLEHRTKDKLEHRTKDKLEHRTKDKLEHRTKGKLEHKTKDKLEHRTKDKLEHRTKE